MTDEKLYTRGNLCSLKGVSNDSLRYWFDEGLLVPLPAEPRKHRRFSEGEAKIAALLGAARTQGLDITALRALSGGVRTALQFRMELRDQIGGDPEFDEETAVVRSQARDEGHLQELMERLWLAWRVDQGISVISLYIDDSGEWKLYTLADLNEGIHHVSTTFPLSQVLKDFDQ